MNTNAKTKTIDPKTTRRTVDAQHYAKNSALYATYRVLATEVDPTTERPVRVVLERKPEFC